MSSDIIYPATPQNISDAILKPTAMFRREVFKVLLSILFFIAVYFVLVAAAFLLAFLCGYGGIMLIIHLPKLITLIIGVGLIGVGVMVVFFLFKFLGKRNNVDRSHLTEIRERDQPELFAFIRRLTKETQTPFPKKIYISSDVNAAVFYDSSFWSMLLPIRKNLQIGLGLVNSVTLSEFKAILAHEFGHFSQRSMKLGSYVYNVNHIIYNLLYDNDNYGETLQSWANLHAYFAFFAGVTVKIVRGIQWILQGVYGIVNKSYMSLSRQMEFHADTVAAYVSGSDPLITSLRRLDVANLAYNRLFACYNDWYGKGLKPDNLYPQHTEVMTEFAAVHHLPVEHGLPQVDAHAFANYNRSRVEVKDQWASHPSNDDREANLRSLNIPCEPIHLSAWTVFRNAEALQKTVTEKIYKDVRFENTPQIVDINSFRELHREETEKYKLDDRYKGFFDYRHISAIDLRNVEQTLPGDVYSLEQLLDDPTVNLPLIIDGLTTDLNTLENIQKGALPVQTFEFSHQKYRKADCSRLIDQLKKELDEAKEKLETADRHIIAFFLKQAGKQGQAEKLREKYSELFLLARTTEDDLTKYNHIIQDLQPLYQGRVEIAVVHHLMSKIKLHEAYIRERLTMFLENPADVLLFAEWDKEKVTEYLAKDHVYFNGTHFDNDAMALLADAVNIYYNVVSQRSLHYKKALLQWQLSFVDQEQPSFHQ